jgi:zinc ribbon protein
VSLRECPDCGNNISRSARACPHCGRPGRKAHLPIELAGGLGLAVICILAFSWHFAWQDDTATAGVTPPAPPQTVIARPYRHLEQSLTALVSYNRTLKLLRVESQDGFPWTDCQLSLNSHRISGYDLGVKSIEPGLTDAALLRSAEFVDPDGKTFDPSTSSVATLDLDCASPHGRLYYGGKFGAADSAAH